MSDRGGLLRESIMTTFATVCEVAAATDAMERKSAECGYCGRKLSRKENCEGCGAPLLRLRPPEPTVPRRM